MGWGDRKANGRPAGPWRRPEGRRVLFHLRLVCVSDGSCGSRKPSTDHRSRVLPDAGVAQLVERHVANVVVEGSIPFSRSNLCIKDTLLKRFIAV